MSLGNTIIMFLGFLILVVSMLIILVGFLFIFRASMVWAFDFDYVTFIKELKKKNENKNIQ